MTEQERLEQVAEECMYQLSYLRIPVGNVRGFTVNRRAISRWGQCKQRPEGYYINISSILCDGKHDDGLRSTIFHELIHTCPGCMNHGEKWKHWAAIVTEHTGLIIQRADSCEDKGVDRDLIRSKRNYKYEFKCNGCGAIVKRERASRFTKNYEHYVCAKCKGKFTRIK